MIMELLIQRWKNIEKILNSKCYESEYYIFALLLLSCNSGSNKRKAEVERFTKLEEFLLLPFDSVMNMYDLSNDSIVDFPDLSSYTIKSLNLSGNLLDTIIPHFYLKDWNV